MPFMFESLEVYRKAMEFVVAVYDICQKNHHSEDES